MAARQNKNEELNQGTGAKVIGDITESVVGGVTTGIGEIGRVTGRALGEGVGGIIDGCYEGGTALVEAFAGPRDPDQYREWMGERMQRKNDKAALKAEMATAKSLQPVHQAIAQIKAVQGLGSQFGAPAPTLDPEALAKIVEAAVDKAMATRS